MTHRLITIAALALTPLVALPARAANLSFTTFVTSSDLSAALGNNSTIGFAYTGTQFVGSVYQGTNNNQLYSTNLSGGNVQKFGTPIPGFGDEIYVSASLGQGGFNKGHVFAGSQDGSTIVRLSPNGSSQSTFVSSGITEESAALHLIRMVLTATK